MNGEHPAGRVDDGMVPERIDSAMTRQMRAVLDIQTARSRDCNRAGERAAGDVMDAEDARIEAMRAEYRA